MMPLPNRPGTVCLPIPKPTACQPLVLSTHPDWSQTEVVEAKLENSVLRCEDVVRALRLPWPEEVQATAEGVLVPSYCAQLSLANRPHWGPGYTGVGRRSSLFGMVMVKKAEGGTRGVDYQTSGRDYDSQYREWDLWDDIHQEATEGQVHTYTDDDKAYYHSQKMDKIGTNLPRVHSFQVITK